MKGALDVVLDQCSYLPDGSPLTSTDKQHILETGQEFGKGGLRG